MRHGSLTSVSYVQPQPRPFCSDTHSEMAVQAVQRLVFITFAASYHCLAVNYKYLRLDTETTSNRISPFSELLPSLQNTYVILLVAPMILVKDIIIYGNNVDASCSGYLVIRDNRQPVLEVYICRDQTEVSISQFILSLIRGEDGSYKLFELSVSQEANRGHSLSQAPLSLIILNKYKTHLVKLVAVRHLKDPLRTVNTLGIFQLYLSLHPDFLKFYGGEFGFSHSVD